MFDNSTFQKISVSPASKYYVKGIAQKRDDSKDRQFRKQLYKRNNDNETQDELRSDDTDDTRNEDVKEETASVKDLTDLSENVPEEGSGEKQKAIDIVV